MDTEKILIPNSLHNLGLSAFDFTTLIQLIYLKNNMDDIRVKDVNQLRYDTGLISSVDKEGKPRSGKTSNSLKSLENRGLIKRKGHAIIINLPDDNKGYHLIYSWVLLDKSFNSCE